MRGQAVILAGGRGTRLGELTKFTPKPMLKINGRYFLEYIIEYLSQNNIKEVIIVAGYLGNLIYNEFNNKNYKGKLRIKVLIEKNPLGTGGFILKFNDILDDIFFLLNGDTIFNVDLKKLYLNLDNSRAIIALKKIKKNLRYGNVILNKKSEITDFEEKKINRSETLINGGIYLIRKNLKSLINDVPISIENEIFPSLVKMKEIKGFIFNDYFVDIGIEKDFFSARKKITQYIELK